MSKFLKVIVVGISVLLLTLPAYAQEAAKEESKQTAKEESKQEAVKEMGKQEAFKDQGKQAAAKDQVTQEFAKEQRQQEAAKEHREWSKGLDEQVQEIKTDVLAIAAQLNRLEEKLLYPSDTQVAVFVSLAAGAEKFRLDAVDVEMDGKQVAHHLYTFKELEALQKGGVQRIHVGNLRTGEHPLHVTVLGKTEGGSDFKRDENFKITKGVGPKLVGVVLAGTGIGSKTITMKDW
jgi:hypothetical protein